MQRVRRAAGAAVVPVVLVPLLLAGCGRYGDKLRQRELVVHFEPGATQQQHLAARAACSGVPHTSPEPIGSDTRQSSLLNNVRFRIDNASYRELARLTECLNRQPGVRGIDIPETM